MEPDERRSAALLAWPDTADPDSAALREPFRHAATPSFPRRLYQEVALKRGWMEWDRHAAPLQSARREALGPSAEGPLKALIRVDELPHARGFDSSGRFGIDAYRRFHAVLAEAGVPYLLAITPRVSRDFLDPATEDWRPLEDAEVELMRELQDDGVVFALHGLDHRTRYESPRRHSEFCGLGVAATEERLDTALRAFAELGLETPVFVAPFNRFDAAQYDALAARFEVVCGGPESVRLLGFHPPSWRGDAVYLPSYRPLYGKADDVVVGLRRFEERNAALWAPATLHWGWELEDEFAALRRLCAALDGRAADWNELLGAVAASRAA